MAKISVPKKHIQNFTPHQIQELPYTQHLINDLLLIQKEIEPNYAIQSDVIYAYIQVPTNYYMPHKYEELTTIAELGLYCISKRLQSKH